MKKELVFGRANRKNRRKPLARLATVWKLTLRGFEAIDVSTEKIGTSAIPINSATQNPAQFELMADFVDSLTMDQRTKLYALLESIEG